MQRKTFGIGIVGTGSVAGAHIDNFGKTEGCEIVAVCSRDGARAEAKIAAHGLRGARAYDDYDAPALASTSSSRSRSRSTARP
jgi:predicted dehydrogenase